jgi:glycosyltransferase involved in cell wall biosynthesis
MTVTPLPISVIIPCYRCSDTVGRAVTSVAMQSMPPTEIILVDDCSNDGTLENLRRLQKKYPPEWIKVITQSENGGPGTARNTGWATASQPYIAFLDADDAWHQDKLKIQYQMMLAEPDTALSGHLYRWSKTEHFTETVSSAPAVSRIGILNLLLKNRFSTPTVLLKRDIPFRFTVGKKYCEDYDLWLQIVANGGKALLIHLPLAYLYKAPYGESGLSAQLWKMEQGELEAYLHLYHTRKLNAFLFGAFMLWSIGKYLLRLAKSLFRDRFARKKTKLQVPS